MAPTRIGLFSSGLVMVATTGLGVAAPAARPSQEATAGASADEDAALFVSAGKVIVRPGHVLEDAQVRIERGRIVAVGTDLEAPPGARRIEGEVVCAGFFDAWTTLGVTHRSANDRGTTAATRTVDGFDPFTNDHLRLDALRAGVVVARVHAGMTAPIGGIGSVVRLAPGLPRESVVLLEDADVQASVGLSAEGKTMDVFDRLQGVSELASHIEAGAKYRRDQREYERALAEWQEAIAEKEKELQDDFKKAKKDREEDLAEAEEKGREFKEKRYKEDRKPRRPRFDADKEVFARLAEGEVPLVVQVHRAAELRDLLRLTEGMDRLRIILIGATQAVHLAADLAERRVPVVVWPAPLGEGEVDEWRGHDLALAGRLAEAGVQVLFGSGGRAEATRDLPLFAALAVGHGFDRESAFEALTIGAARALDLGDQLGTLERGKDADLLVLTGEPLDTTTRVRFVVSAGRVVLEPEDAP